MVAGPSTDLKTSNLAAVSSYNALFLALAAAEDLAGRAGESLDFGGLWHRPF